MWCSDRLKKPISVHIMTDTRSEPAKDLCVMACCFHGFSFIIDDVTQYWLKSWCCLTGCTDCSGFTRKPMCPENTSVFLCLQHNKETHTMALSNIIKHMNLSDWTSCSITDDSLQIFQCLNNIKCSAKKKKLNHLCIRLKYSELGNDGLEHVQRTDLFTKQSQFLLSKERTPLSG